MKLPNLFASRPSERELFSERESTIKDSGELLINLSDESGPEEIREEAGRLLSEPDSLTEHLETCDDDHGGAAWIRESVTLLCAKVMSRPDFCAKSLPAADCQKGALMCCAECWESLPDSAVEEQV